MLFGDVVAASRVIAATRSRLAKADSVAALLAAADPDEVTLVVRCVLGPAAEETERHVCDCSATGVAGSCRRELR